MKATESNDGGSQTCLARCKPPRSRPNEMKNPGSRSCRHCRCLVCGVPTHYFDRVDAPPHHAEISRRRRSRRRRRTIPIRVARPTAVSCACKRESTRLTCYQCIISPCNQAQLKRTPAGEYMNIEGSRLPRSIF